MSAPVSAVPDAPEQRRTTAVRSVPRALLLGLVAAALVLLVLRSLVPPTDHGHTAAATGLGAVARLATWAAGVVTVGWLALVALVLDRAGGPLSGHQRTCLRPAARTGIVWAAVALGAAVLAAAQAGGGLLEQSGLLVAAVSALGVAVAAPVLRSSDGANALLVLAGTGLVLPAAVGHDGSAAERVAVVAHVAAASTWVGGLCALLALVRWAPEVVEAALPRFSGLALLCVAALAASGAVAASASLADLGDLGTTGFGRLLLLKVGLVAAACWLGALHRRRVLRRLPTAGLSAAFRRLAAAEVVLLAVVLGVAVALSQAAPG